MLLGIAYCAPVEYYALLSRDGEVQGVNCLENYEKQSYRNRCTILSANGPLDLRVPVVHGPQRGIESIMVDYSTPWVRQTLYAIESAYFNSPFYEFYKDEFEAVYNSAPSTLWELDWKLMEFFCRKIGIQMPAKVSLDSPVADIHPKHPSSFQGKRYIQVFEQKFGFVSNLSVIDLLFCCGPESIDYLK